MDNKLNEVRSIRKELDDLFNLYRADYIRLSKEVNTVCNTKPLDIKKICSKQVELENCAITLTELRTTFNLLAYITNFDKVYEIIDKWRK